MPFTFNPFTGNLDYYYREVSVIGTFTFIDETGFQFIDESYVDFIS